MSDSAIRLIYRHDSTAHTLKLLNRLGTPDSGSFAYSRPDANHLLMQGVYHGDSLTLRLVKSNKTYLLTSRGYNWVQEQPFNR